MKNFTRIMIGVAVTLMIAPATHAQNVIKNRNLGIGTINPAQKIEIGGNNTARIDALGTGGGNVVSPIGAVTFLYINNANGDMYSIPGVNSSVIYMNGGVPTWGSAASAFNNIWNITGGDNISATYGANFLGTTNNTQLQFKGIGYSGATLSTIGLIDPVNKNIYFGSYSTSGSAGAATSTALVSGSIDNVAIGSGAMGTAVANTSNNVFVGYLSGLLYKATTAGMGSVGVGSNALRYVTTGTPNSAFGYQALGGTASFTTATNNLAMGYQSGFSHTTGTKDVSIGDYSLYNTTTSSNNVAVGNHALYTNSTSTGNNTAVGYYSQETSSTGLGGNTSEGYYGDYDNGAGNKNVGIGYFTMEVSTSNSENVAIGNFAGRALNSISVANGPIVAIGDSAFYTATTSYKGVAIGFMALRALSASPSTDVAIGYGAQQGNSGSYDVAIGSQAWFKGTTSAQYSVVLGAGAGQGTGYSSEDIAIGTAAMGSTSATNSGTTDIAIGSATSMITTPATTSSVAYGATFGNLTGSSNVGIGSGAGYSLTSPSDNTIIGVNAGFNMTTPSINTIIGYNAAYNLTTGADNVFVGANAVNAATTGSFNVAIGGNTQLQGTPGTSSYNIIIGANATAAYGTVATSVNEYNVALGYNAFAGVSTGTANNYSAYNVALGANANASSPAAAGLSATNAGVAIGYSAQALAVNSVAIGANAYANTANTAILGSINGVNGATSNVSVGINKAAPAQALEVTGGTSTTGTIRVDGLNSSGNTYYKQTTTTSNLVYSLNSTGDLYSLPNGTANQQLILNSIGVPTWGSASFSMTASYPLVNSGGSVPSFSLVGDTIGTVLLGRDGTTSRWDSTGAGAIGTILTSVTAPDSIEWQTISATGGPNDNWGNQFAETDSSSLLSHATITGNGTSLYPLRLAKQTAANGQTLAWYSTGGTWKPATFNSTLTTQSITPLTGSVITVANGTNQVLGIGNVTLDLQGTAGGILIGNGASSATFTGAGTSGYTLTSNGSSAPSWQPLSVPLPWALTGNAGIVPGTNFIGTTDDKQFRFYVGGISSTFTGNAGSLDPQLVSGTAFANTYLGAVVATSNHGAGDNDQGSYNAGIGYASMAYTNSSATYDVALGAYALEGNGGTMSSSYIVAAGYRSVVGITNGGSNETAIGYQTLGGVSSTSSNSNTAIGYQSMYGNNANATYYGSYDVASGYNSFYNSSNSNAAASNTAMGSLAEYQTSTSTNTAIGDSALYSNSTGTLNTAVGYASNDSLSSYINATTIGAQAEAKQSNALILGSIKNVNGATASTNVGIGTNAPASDAAIAIKKNHLETQGQLAPGNVFTSVTNAGTTSSAVITSATDMGGTISFTAGTSGLNSGQQLTVYFGTPYTYAPIVTITPANAAAASAMTINGAYVSSGQGSFTINFNTPPTSGQTYKFNYFIIETPGTLAGSEPCSVPITLTNSSSSATPTGFQQMVTVNSSSFTSYETPGLTNVEFSTSASGGGTVLNAWLESANNATFNLSTSTIYWVNLGSTTIPAGQSITIYMDFLSATTMTGTGGVMGEAPQLSGLGANYGIYDNGPLVFNFYDNFLGTSLNATKWTSYSTGSGNFNVTVNNGISITSISSNNSDYVISSANSYSPNLVAETYASGSSLSGTSGNRSYMPGLSNINATTEGDYLGDQNSNETGPYFMAFSAGRNGVVTYVDAQGYNNAQFYNDLNTNATGWEVQGLGYTGSTNYWYTNYSLVTSSNSDAPSGNVYFMLGSGNYGGSAGENVNISAYWARTRQYPPSATMPSAIVGGTVTCTGSGSQPSEPNPCDIPITITNSQSTATSTGFQQMIVVNSSAYASDGEDANLDNVLFSTGAQGTGTSLYAWVESGASSASSSTVYWVNLGTNTIPAGGSITIYMNFIQTGPVMTSQTSFTGEAPQLSGTYAQYDNGGIVFPNVYTRWGNLSGGSVPTTVGTGAINGGGITIYNGSDMTITNNATNTELSYITGDVGTAIGVAYTSVPTSVNTFPNVLESYVTTAGEYEWFGTSNGEEEDGTGVNVEWDNGAPSGNVDFYVKSNSQSFNHVTTEPLAPTTPVVWSILERDSATIESILANYTPVLGTYAGSTSSGTVNLYQPIYFGYFGTWQNNPNNPNLQYIYWTRTRTYPPGGVMPATSPGTLNCCQPTSAPGSITGPGGTFCPGTTATYSISAVAGATSYNWTVPSGATINSGQGTTSINITYGYISGTISVVAINACGASSASSATATLSPSYTITGQPSNSSTSCTTGSVATFTVTATGGGLTYQWQVSTDGGSTWNNVSNGGIYSNVTTATLTVTSPPLTDNGYEYRCNVSGSCGGPISSNAATLNVYGNIPITITNSQSTATPTNFPEMITVNSANYTAQEMSGLQNVEFTIGGPAGTGTPLQSWLESGNTNTSTNTIYWINLGSNTIAASSSITIYMNFMSSNVLSASGPAGEAPQLSGGGANYALYDNGANIFEYYANFAGTSLPSGLSITAGTATVNNGLKIPAAGQNVNIVSGSTGYNFTQNILETDGYDGTSLGSNANDRYLVWNDQPSGATNAIYITGSYYIYGTCAGPLAIVTSGVTGSNIWSLWQNGSNAIGTYNYTTSTSAASTCSTSSSYYISLGTAGGGSFYQYLRIRTVPPSAVMPSSSMGSLTCCSAPPALGSISGPTGPFCPGATASYSVSAVAGASSYLWTVPTGATITLGQGTTSINVTYGNSGGNITVTAQNSCDLSGTASTLAVTNNFSITSQPVNASTSCATGSTATFSVTATGTNTEQWQVSTDGGSTWNNISNGGIYSGVTTTTLTVSNPPTTDNGYEYRCVLTSVTCGGTLNSNAATLNVYGNVPITITNSQSTATPTNFPQMITVNSSSFTAQEMSGLQNVEFTIGGPAGTGTPLQSWLESGNTNISSSTVYWVNLGSNTIPASSSIIIYMNFMASNVLSSSGPAGEAPQLSGTYAQYDNGASVFPSFYDNFKGTSLASQWTNSGGANIAVSNGLILTNNGNNWFGPYTNTFSSALGNVAESYCSASAVGNGGTGLDICTGISSSSTGMDAQLDANIGYGSGGSVQSAPGANQNFFGSNIVSANTYYVFSVSISNTPGPVEQVNYGAVGSLTGNSGTAVTPANSPVGLGVSGANGSFQWFRIRPNAPSSVMPTALVGSLSCCTDAPPVGSITGSTGPFCPGATATYSITAVGGATSYVWTVPTGATITSGQGTTSINVTYGNNGGNITVSAENICGLVGTASTLAVTDNFSITSQPVNATTSCATGGTVTFSVTATGTNTYQWQVDSTGTWSNITTSRNGVYSGYTTNTLTVTAPPFSMNGYQYRCVITSTTCGGTLTSNAATLGVLGNIPITLTNSQSTATSANFEQMLTVNSSNYTSQELSGLQNVEFTVGGPAGTGTALESWLESGNTNTSTSTVYWVNLGTNIIPANGTLTIYMNFMTTSVLNAAGPAGEAPDLSTPYAFYDNGGLVFPNVYTRWGSNATGVLPTTIGTGAINGGAISQLYENCTTPNSPLVITNSTNYTQVQFVNNNNCSNGATTSDVNGVYYSSTPSSSYDYPTVIESKVSIADWYSWFGTGFGQEEQGEGAVVAWDEGCGCGVFSVRSDFNYQGVGNYCATSPSTYANIDDNTNISGSSSSTPNPVAVWSILLNWNGTNDQITNVLNNYTAVTGPPFPIDIDGQGAVNDQTGCTLTTKYGYFGTAQNGTTTPYEQIYWTRTRQFPPAGVMPTATYYSMTCCNAPVTPGGISSSPTTTTFCPGATATYSISAVAGASSYVWTVPSGSSISSGQGTTSINVTLGANSGTVSVATTNSCGEQSSPSTYSVTSLTAFTTQPSNAGVSCANVGTQSANFTVGVTGATAWQWQVSTDGGSTWNNLSNGAPYSNVTTATMTVTDPSTAYNGYEYRCIVTTSSCGAATSNSATLTVSSLNSVPITITNSASSATPTNFQEMLLLNFTGYGSASPALASNLNNVLFSTGPSGTGKILYAWFENSSTSTLPATAPSTSSTAAVVWVNLGSTTIAGSGGSTTIYMTFEPSAVMGVPTGATAYTGEAPELTTPYGEYDNGAEVFTFYDDFAGTSLDANWTNYNYSVGGTATLTVNNGITINNTTVTSGSTTYAAVDVLTSANSYAPNLVTEIYANGGSPTSASRSYMPGLTSNTSTAEGVGLSDYNSSYGIGTGASTNSYVCFGNGRNALVEYSWLQGAPSSPSPYNDYNEYQTNPSGYNVIGIVYSPTSNYMDLNYNQVAIGSSTYSPLSGTNMYMAIGQAAYNGTPAATTMSAYWARIRNYPPNNTMPGASTGSYGCH